LKPISPPTAGAASLARLRNKLTAAVALIAALLLPAPAAHAQCDARLQCCATPRPGGDPSCGGDSPTELPPSGPRVGAGNPLDIVTGNKHQRETDLPAMPGVLGLELVRHYNSALSHRNDGRLGRGWRLSYQAELVAGSESLSIVQADGTTVRFTRGIVEPDAYLSPDPTHGRVQRIRSSTGEHFMWTWPNGRTLRFDHGKLTTVMEASGEFVSLTYAPNGVLMQVRDPQNRAMYLIYDRQWRLVGVDTPVGRFSYAHDGRPGNLVKATHPGDGNLTRTYHYEDARHPHALTGITAAGGGSDGRALVQRLTTWAYDDKAHAVSSVQGDGTGHVDRVTVQRRYTDKGGEAKLINSLGHTTLYRWRTIAGQSRLLEAIGPGCSTCGPTNMRYGYDKQGRLTESTRLNDKGKPAETIRHALDPRGRVVETSRILHNQRTTPPRSSSDRASSPARSTRCASCATTRASRSP
jgi:hypothetical protein